MATSLVVEPAAELLSDLAELLAVCRPLEGDPVRATGLAATVLAPAQDLGADPELASLLPGTLEGLGDRCAVPLLLRVAELARPPAALAARAALARLASAGVWVEELRPLRVVEAWRVEASAAEAFAIDLGRGDGVESRVFVLLDRRGHPDGVVAAGCGGGPRDGETLEMIVPRDFEGGSDPERVDTPVIASALLKGCRRAADTGREIPPELAIALTLLARPVLGDPEALPVLPVDPTDVALDDPDLELAVDPAEDEAQARIDALLREYEHEYLPLLASDNQRDRRNTDLFVANAMLSYKAHYSDGLLGDWPLEELTEFMLEFWPRKVTADDDTELGAPASISRFLGFLDARDSLSGASRKRLARAVSELLEPFIDSCVDSANWGLAKSTVMRAASTGVDIHDRNALEAYFAEQQSPAGSRSTPSAHRATHDQRRARRKATKNARRRNRR
jgi:hypothetical protein